MGLFGTTIPEEYGGLGLGLDTYALIVIGAVARLGDAVGDPQRVVHRRDDDRAHGTEEQRRRYLPGSPPARSAPRSR